MNGFVPAPGLESVEQRAIDHGIPPLNRVPEVVLGQCHQQRQRFGVA